MKKKSRTVSDLVTEVVAASDRMTDERRAYLHAFAMQKIPADVIQFIEELNPIADDADATEVEFTMIRRQAIYVGFWIALARYSRELKTNREAMAILNARTSGTAKGRASQAKAKAEREARIREMFAKGIDVQEIATEVKRSVPTVYRALAAPQSKASTRRRSPRR